VLHRAKVLNKIRQVGLTPESLTWRKIDGTVINTLAGLQSGGEESATVIHPAEDLAGVFLEEVSKQPSVTVHWGHKVVSAGQNEARAWVDIEGGKRLEGDFVVGCDGASSVVRKSLFGNKFDGKTWDKIIMGTNVTFKNQIRHLTKANIRGSCVMTLKSMVGKIHYGSSIQIILLLSAKSRRTEYGACPTVKTPAFLVKNSKQTWPTNCDRSFLETLRPMSTKSSHSIHT
jgi:2-polyprenyl-6-methoxyphenol hydroxylase-like FAD-dependent oxidoreductase